MIKRKREEEESKVGSKIGRMKGKEKSAAAKTGDKLTRARALLGDLNKKTSGGGSGNKRWLQPGKNVLRPLPVETSEGNFYKVFNEHGFVGANNESFLCARDIKKRCVCCDKADKMLAPKGDKKAWAAKRKWMPRKRVAIVALAYIPEKFKEPKIFELPLTAFRDYLTYYTDVDEYGEITDLASGRDVVITRTGEQLDTKYSVALRDEGKSKQLDESIMEDCPDLNEVYGEEVYPSVGKQKAILEGIEYEEDEEEEDEAPAKKKKKASKGEDEDGDDVDDDSEGDEGSSEEDKEVEEDEESSEDDEDDDEDSESGEDDEDDEDDEEEERTKKKKKK